MKFNKIIQMAAKNKVLTIINDVNGQWLNIGAACYFIGNTKFNVENIKPILDKGDSWFLSNINTANIKDFSFADTYPFEEMAITHDITFNYIDKTISLFSRKDGSTILIDEKLLIPFIEKDADIKFYIRNNAKFDYLAVKRGLILIGVVLPLDVGDGFKKDIENINRLVQLNHFERNKEEILKAFKEFNFYDLEEEENEDEILNEQEGFEDVL
nr:MAG TPA: hypothetical protein [Caudoviricetes sp.]